MKLIERPYKSVMSNMDMGAKYSTIYKENSYDYGPDYYSNLIFLLFYIFRYLYSALKGIKSNSFSATEQATSTELTLK